MQAVKNNRTKNERQKFLIANMVKNVNQINNIERRMRTENERRVKTAQVSNIRTSFKNGTAQQANRRALKSAVHMRTYSLS
jgi:hypothetical protein